VTVLSRSLRSRLKHKITERLKQTYRNLRGSTDVAPIDVERAEQTFYIDYLRQGMIVFDVGANVGELSLLFSRFVQPSGKVFSFEASSATFTKLSTICCVAERDNVEVNNIAVSDVDGVLELCVYPHGYSGWNSLTDRPLALYGIDVKPVKREQVRSCTLDTFCRDRGITHVDLLKIDVEGSELQVLLGARHMLEQKRIRCCAFEFGQTTFDAGNTAAMIEKFLAEVGYRIRNIVPGKPCFPGRESRLSAKFSMHVAEPK
jgi:FkbM family methyltransferase